jgi:hypothetical protein
MAFEGRKIYLAAEIAAELTLRQITSVNYNAMAVASRQTKGAKWAEWEKYKIQPSTISNASHLNRIGHTCHIDQAASILQDGRIKPRLVFNKSRLNKKRILVAWLSPNHWSAGYRYGSIKFEFDFSDIVKNKRFYWVEAITKYSPAACRILIADQDRSNILNVYDPTNGDGPWYHDKKKDRHYFNEKAPFLRKGLWLVSRHNLRRTPHRH